jgi:hypothetical protein
MIHGDVSIFKIGNKSKAIRKGEFFKVLPMKLVYGYNQIPIYIEDSVGNFTNSYMEITIEDIKSFVDININN